MLAAADPELNNVPAILTLVGVVFTGLMSLIGVIYSAQAHRKIRNVDDAVNHRHKNEPRLLDMVRDVAHGTVQNSEAIHRVQADVTEVHTELAATRSDLSAHVTWEESQKYQTPGQIEQMIRDQVTEVLSGPPIPHEADTL